MLTEEQKRILELTEELDTAYDALIKLQKEYESLDNAAAKDLEELQTLQQENERLKEERRLSLRNLENGAMRASGEPALTFYKMLVELFQQNGGKNFLTLTVEKPDKSERYAITIQNLNGELSPAEKMESLQQQNKQLIDALTEITKEYHQFVLAGSIARDALQQIQGNKT